MQFSTPLLLLGHVVACSAASDELTANFDDLTASPVPIGGVGISEGVFYNAFSLAEQSLTGIGVAAHTAPNFIDTNSQQQSTNGTPTLIPAAPYTSIGLIDLWFACVVHTGQGAVVVATQCTIVVAGFNDQNEEVTSASYTFTPRTGSVEVPMIEANLSTAFHGSGIKNVTIVQSDPVTQSLLLDSITLYLYK